MGSICATFSAGFLPLPDSARSPGLSSRSTTTPLKGALTLRNANCSNARCSSITASARASVADCNSDSANLFSASASSRACGVLKLSRCRSIRRSSFLVA